MRPIFVMVKCRPGTAYDVAARRWTTSRKLPNHFHFRPGDLLVKCYLPTDADVRALLPHRQTATLPRMKDTLTVITFNAFT